MNDDSSHQQILHIDFRVKIRPNVRCRLGGFTSITDPNQHANLVITINYDDKLMQATVNMKCTK